MIFRVVYKNNGENKVETFTSFAAAAGCASALTGLTRSIVAEVAGQDGIMYTYDPIKNVRKAVDKSLIDLVTRISNVKGWV